MSTDYVYNKSDYLSHVALLKPNGYSMNSEGAYLIEDATRRIEIEFGKITYYPHCVTFMGISIDYRFHAVEDILYQVWSGFSNLKFGAGPEQFTFAKGFGIDVLGETELWKMRETEVENDASFHFVRASLEALLNSALSFANTYTTLQQLYSYGESLTIDNRADFYGQPLTFRAMIIKKILNTSDYATYSTHIVNQYTNVNPDPERSAFATALKAHLDSL
jgi:hypothetical protein